MAHAPYVAGAYVRDQSVVEGRARASFEMSRKPAAPKAAARRSLRHDGHVPSATEESRALSAIAEHGVLLVYPLENRRDPPSLWHALYPRSAMQWSWDAEADPRVSAVWRLRTQLAQSREVVYGKWFRGRATFFSVALFSAMLATFAPWRREHAGETDELLRLLEEDSPQSSKNLRALAGLQGREGERAWTRGLGTLWTQLLIVGTGEVDDGAFPSLEIGATRWVFEELWESAQQRDEGEARTFVDRQLPAASAFGKYWRKLLREIDQ
jgi:hypothetical protein